MMFWQPSMEDGMKGGSGDQKKKEMPKETKAIEYWVKYRRVEVDPERAGASTTTDLKRLSGKSEAVARRSLKSWLKREQDIMGFTQIKVLELLEIRKRFRKLSLIGVDQNPHKVNEVSDYVIKFEKNIGSASIFDEWSPKEIRLGRITRRSANWQFGNWKGNLKNPNDYRNIQLVKFRTVKQ